MPNLSNEDRKFLIKNLQQERIAAALEAILLQIIVFSIFIFLNMTGVSEKFSISIGLIYVITFVFSLIYSLVTFVKNKKKTREISKIEKTIK